MSSSAFPSVPIGELVDRVVNPVDVEPDTMYEQIGVRSHGKGLFYKEPVTGESLGEKRVFWVEPDCFVVNIVFAWEQAIGKTTEADRGKIASHRFPMFRPKEGKVALDYLTYLFKTEYGKHLLGLASPGGAGRNKTLGQAEFLRIAIPCPPIAEQEKLVEILSAWDAATTKIEQLIANARAQKQALSQLLLTGKRRLTSFSGEWKHTPLGEVCILRGGSAFKEEFQGQTRGELPFIKVSDMSLPGNRIKILEANHWVSRQLAVEMRSTIFPAGAVVFAKVGAALLLNRRRILTRDTIIDNNMMAALPTKAVSTKFLYQALLALDFGHVAQDGALPSINQAQVAAVSIMVPPTRREQEAVADILDTADQDIEYLLDQRQLLMAERSALLQQLLSGKRRVSTKKEAA